MEIITPIIDGNEVKIIHNEVKGGLKADKKLNLLADRLEAIDGFDELFGSKFEIQPMTGNWEFYIQNAETAEVFVIGMVGKNYILFYYESGFNEGELHSHYMSIKPQLMVGYILKMIKKILKGESIDSLKKKWVKMSQEEKNYIKQQLSSLIN